MANDAVREAFKTEDVVANHGNSVWEAIWSVIRGWDISRHNDGMYSSTTGDDCQRIFLAVNDALLSRPAEGTGEAVEDANGRFERLAEAFYKATGRMAPGKDVPMALGQDDEAERIALWRVFRAGVSAAHPAPASVSEVTDAMVIDAVLAYNNWNEKMRDAVRAQLAFSEDRVIRMRHALLAALAARPEGE